MSKQLLCHVKFDCLKEDLQKKTAQTGAQESLLPQDNTPSHESTISMAKLSEFGFQLRPHPLYTPELVLSDFFLFVDLKILLGGRKFSSSEDAINAYFAALDSSLFFDEVKLLVKTNCFQKNVCNLYFYHTYQAILVYPLVCHIYSFYFQCPLYCTTDMFTPDMCRAHVGCNRKVYPTLVLYFYLYGHSTQEPTTVEPTYNKLDRHSECVRYIRSSL